LSGRENAAGRWLGSGPYDGFFSVVVVLVVVAVVILRFTAHVLFLFPCFPYLQASGFSYPQRVPCYDCMTN
jgi:hypothetical protein